ncbi:MAG: hypothetical protein J7J42_01800 [Thermoplasmata archaeon]|nr:hypothetical protein [Thermoplasmata archaeon]
MTPRSLAKEIAADIEERLAEYLQEREVELEERVKAGVEMTQTWGGYEITIAGHRIIAEHDSSMHRWRFRLLERDYEEFFNISEKKGQAIMDFLCALSEAINPSVAAAVQGEENLAEDQDEDSFVSAEQDPVIQGDDSFVGDGDDLTSR